FSTTSYAARNSSSLEVKWWYSAPRVTPARSAMSSRPAPANPRSANSSQAASSSAAWVASRRSAWLRREWPLTIRLRSDTTCVRPACFCACRFCHTKQEGATPMVLPRTDVSDGLVTELGEFEALIRPLTTEDL